ncbi:MAG: V-type ATPase subunit [Candidatus Hydrothermarchaeales archaeon]
MSIAQYAFVNARIGAMRSYLLEPTQIRSMVESPSLEDALSFLKTSYGGELAKLTSPSLRDVEDALVMSLVHDYEKLTKSVVGLSRTFLERYAKKLEIISLKTLIIMKLSKTKVEHYPFVLYRTITKETVDKLLQMETIEEMVEMLKLTEYYEVLKKAMASHKEDNNPYPFLVALDTYIFGRLGEIMGKMKGKDKEMVRRLIGVEIDYKNFMTALRLMGTDEALAWESLIPYRYALKDEHLRNLINLRSISELPTQLVDTKYREIVTQGVREFESTGSLHGLEREFQKYMFKQYRYVFYGDRFHIGLPIAYLNLKENEIRNVVAILKGKESGLPVEKIEETVLISGF